MTEISSPASAGPDAREPRRSFVIAAAAVALLFFAAGVGATLLLLRLQGHSAGPTAADTAHARHQPESLPPSTAPPSDAAVYVSPARQQLIGVRTAVVAEQPREASLRTTGVLAYDETRIADVHTKVSGWIERVSVDFVGKAVRRGEPLFSVYSPDLVATQKEYLLALAAQARLGDSRFQETRTGAASLLAAARERLRLWDFTDGQVAELERTGEPQKSVTMFSPVDGVVLERNAFPGQYITPDARTFRLADLSRIWAVAQVFEAELPAIRAGQPAQIEFPSGQSSRTVSGRVTYIYPDIDPATRRGRVRIEFANPGLEFRPDAYVTVVLGRGAGRHLAVPREAVIDTGDRQYAIVALPDGYFEPRAIEVGPAAGDYQPVLSGLAAGDRVVTSAQFLIDSESNLRAALAGMSAPGADAEEHGGTAPAPATAPAAPPAPAVQIAYRSDPDPPRTGENQFEVRVTDAAGQPIEDAAVTVTFFMPAMPSMNMPAMRNAVTLVPSGNGAYSGAGQVLTAGRWDVTVTVVRAGQRLGARQLAVIAR